MIEPGTTLDLSFPVQAFVDGEEHDVPFASLVQGPTIVSIYMSNNTGSCDRQTASLSEHEAELASAGYHIIAVSKNGVRSHARYAEKHGFNFTLVSDPDHAFAKATDAIVEKKMRGKAYVGPARAAFVLDGAGTVKAVIYPIDTKAHGQELLEAVANLNVNG